MVTTKKTGTIRQTIFKAIDNGKITHKEYDHIISVVTEDGIIDEEENAYLREIQNLIENGAVRFI